MRVSIHPPTPDTIQHLPTLPSLILYVLDEIEDGLWIIEQQSIRAVLAQPGQPATRRPRQRMKSRINVQPLFLHTDKNHRSSHASLLE